MAEMGVNYKDIIERMKWAGKLKNDSAVARTLELTPQALSNYKKKDEMPSKLVVRFAELNGLYIDWLLTGHGPMYKDGRNPQSSASEGEKVHKVMDLTPEESFYVDKLLRIFNAKNSCSKAAIKHIVDTLSMPDAIVEDAGDEKKAG